jgi:hypothetical protein
MIQSTMPNPSNDETFSDSIKNAKSTAAASQPPQIAVKLLLAAGLFVIALAGIGYKWWEWRVTTRVASFYQTATQKELAQIVKTNEFAQANFYDDDKEEEEKAAAEAKEKEGTTTKKTTSDDDEEFSVESVTKEYDKVLSNYDVFADHMKAYDQLLADHQAEYQKLATKTNLLYGKRKEVLSELIAAQLAFYETERQDVARGQVFLSLNRNGVSVGKDGAALGVFMIKTGGFNNEAAIRSEFSSIAGLEKYTRDDFKFVNEEQIKADHPYGYESLDKQRKYFSGVYDAIKDLVSGDEESAGYKFSRLGDDYADLGTIDSERIESEGREEGKKIDQQLVEHLLRRYQAVEKFHELQLGTYPLLASIPLSNNLSRCYLYVYKTDLYRDIKDNYPQAGSLTELQKELNQITPDLSEIDKATTTDQVEISKDEDRIHFTCKDGDQTYKYSYHFKEDDTKKESDKK